MWQALVLLCSTFAFVTATADAQVSLTTYYVVPPTSGCNGTWAFGPYSDLWDQTGCTGPYVYFFDPATCVDGSQFGQPVPLNVVNDTIIMDLCSLPCGFQFYSAEGLCVQCICGTLTPTGVPEGASEAPQLVGPNPIRCDRPMLVLEHGDDRPYDVQVFDRAGRTVFFRSGLVG